MKALRRLTPEGFFYADLEKNIHRHTRI
jgi:hypothetical protein